VECAEVRAALSARLDGEDAALSGDIVDAHVAHCEECQAWYTQATAIGRDLRLRANPPAPTQGAGAGLAAKVFRWLKITQRLAVTYAAGSFRCWEPASR